ncbi:MAG: hypothetical protein GXZ14_00820 [Ruminococcaceae bacterium]|nr:hypothetical protein [Oscillospiraceae bacterium]
MSNYTSDGSVTIDTSVNFDGIQSGLKQMEQAAGSAGDKTAAEFDKIADAADNAGEAAQNITIEPDSEKIEKANELLNDLNNKLAEQQTLLDSYREEWVSLSQEYGKSSEEARSLYFKMADLEKEIVAGGDASDKLLAAINKLEEAEKSVQASTAGLGEAVDGTSEAMGGAATAAKDLKNAQDDVNNSAQNGKAATMDFGAQLADVVAGSIADAILSLGELADKTEDYRVSLSLLENAAQTSGANIESLRDKAAELNIITGDTKNSMAILTGTLNTMGNETAAAEVIDALAGAVIKFPTSYNLESLATALDRTVSQGAVTGQFATLLEGCGINVDKLNTKLENCSGTADRQNVVLNALARTGLADIYNGYLQANGVLVENEKAQASAERQTAETAQKFVGLNTVLDEIKGSSALGAMFVDIGESVVEFGVKAVASGAGAAAAIALFGKGVATASTSMASASAGVAAFGAAFALTALEITAVATAIALVVQGIANLISACNGNSIGGLLISGDVGGKSIGGYATGTQSASAGWAYVGENGPELVRFAGGEQVVTAAQTNAAVQSGQMGNVIYENHEWHVDASQWRQINDLLRIAENRATTIRKGVL